MKTEKQLERHFKGVANHHRIKILGVIAKNPGITLNSIAEEVGGNMKTISEHTRRLTLAGLVNKKYSGAHVEHVISPYGEIFHKFVKTFQKR